MVVITRLCLSLAALLALSTLTILPVAAQVSAVPSAMNFQGRLATPAGNPVPNGTYSILFSLYDALTGGTLKYSKTISSVNVKNGTFAVTLDTFPAGTFNGNLYLEIKIGSDAALTPRQPLVTVPYAFKAGSVVDGSIVTVSIADAAVTNAKISDVDWTKITGAPSTLLTLPYAATQSLAHPSTLFSITNTADGDTIYAEAANGTALHGKSSNIAVWAESVNAAAVYGSSTNASGVFGGSSNSYGVYGIGNASYGVYGQTYGATSAGVVGDNTPNGNHGELGSSFYGVYGTSSNGTGGYFTAGGTNGVSALSTAANGNGIYAACNNGILAYGVYGVSTTGRGVVGSGPAYGVYSSGPAGGTTGWANVSDKRYKQNIAPIENGLDAILKLHGVTFEYRRGEFPAMNFPEGTHIGFIAQEVEKILPQLVRTDPDGYKSVTYSDAVPVLVEAVKTLNARTIIQQKQNDALKTDNALLKARLDAIERALAELKASR